MMWILLGLLLISLLAITLFLIFYNKQGCYTCSEPKSVQSCPCAACPCPECPEPPPCPCAPCPCPACPTCPDCGSSQPVQNSSGSSSGGIVALDHSTTDTNLENCSGSTILMPVIPGSLLSVPTKCFVPGTEFIVDVPNTSTCESLFRAIALTIGSDVTNQSVQIAMYHNNVEFHTGNGVYPSDSQINALQDPLLDFSQPVAQVAYKLVSDTQIDVYFNGNKVASFTKPSFTPTWIAFAGCDGPTYAKFQPIS